MPQPTPGRGSHLISVDLWVMMAFTILLLAFVCRRRTLARGGGASLLSAYVGYVARLAVSPQ